MELSGVVYAIASPPVGGFHIVQKETKSKYGAAANLVGDSGIQHGLDQAARPDGADAAAEEAAPARGEYDYRELPAGPSPA